jgi:hypothetical protein
MLSVRSNMVDVIGFGEVVYSARSLHPGYRSGEDGGRHEHGMRRSGNHFRSLAYMAYVLRFSPPFDFIHPPYLCIFHIDIVGELV